MIFLDIGSTSINLAHVIAIHRTNLNRVMIEYDVLDGDGPATTMLYGDQATAFREFWEVADMPNMGISIYKVC